MRTKFQFLEMDDNGGRTTKMNFTLLNSMHRKHSDSNSLLYKCGRHLSV